MTCDIAFLIVFLNSTQHLLLTKYYSGDQTKNEMGKGCSMYGGEEKCIQGFGGETRDKETT